MIKDYDFVERVKEKQASRDADDKALAAGQKTREQLRYENSHFASLKFRIDLSGAKSLS
jgi:hypothetical protein